MLSVREIQYSDINLIIQYWTNADVAYLEGMGCDVTKMPTENEWREMLTEQISSPYEEKKSYCIIWLLNGQPIGHCNINKIIFGEKANMHLHLWKNDFRKKGMGVELVKMSLPYFFQNFKLKKLYCEPNTLNPAPNKTLAKVGFTFLKTYRTIPGPINLEQEVNQWEILGYN